MGIFNKPSIESLKGEKKGVRSGLWHKCPQCGENLAEVELKKNFRVCANCQHHFFLPSQDRARVITNCLNGNLSEHFEEKDADMRSVDILKFPDYQGKLLRYQEKLQINEAVIWGVAKIKNHLLSLAIMDFRFLGASMGSVVGEKITRAIEHATANSQPVIIVSSSGGARMHEGILSLMQMAKTSAALAKHAQAKLPYISLLSHPTTGGVTASFATLGDINLAEPGCMIGFAGPRVIKETTRQKLPHGFQTAEFMLKHGLIDRIVHRKDLHAELANILDYLQSN